MNAPLGPPLRPMFGSPTGRDLPLEGLRGLCALAVFYAHIFLPAAAIDPVWVPSDRFWHFNLGAPAVLMFFVLSGYVIGLVTTQPATASHVRTYLVHRVARLVPLNTAAVLLSVLLLPHVTGRAFLGNLLFLENSEPYPGLGAFPLLFNNANLWSLNYEAVYYLGFIALWRCAPPTTLVFGLMGIVVAAHALGAPVSALFARYACGALYWLAGLAIAWHAAPVVDADRRTNWPAALLALLAIWQLGPLRALFYDLSLSDWLWMTTVSPHRLDLLLACVWVLLAVSGRAPRLCGTLTRVCLGWLTVGIILQAWRGEWREVHWVAAAAVGLAAFSSSWKFPLTPLRRCAPLGAISFGLYIIASPFQLGQRVVWPEFSGSWLTFTVRAVVLTFVTLTTAWLLERRLGPPISRWLRGNKANH